MKKTDGPNYLQKLQYNLGLYTLEQTCIYFKKKTGKYLSQSALSRYERNVANISEDKFLLFVKAFGLNSYKANKLRNFFENSEESPMRKRSQSDNERVVKKNPNRKNPIGAPRERLKTKHNLKTVARESTVIIKSQPKEVENYLFLLKELKPILGDKIKNVGVKNGIFQIASAM